MVLVCGIALFAAGGKVALMAYAALEAKGCFPPEPLVTMDEWKAQGEVTFVAVGDMGTGETQQLRVSQAMEQVCQEKGCDFVLGLGDNFYPAGVQGLRDPLFGNYFEAVYGPLNLPFFTVLGNHDLKGNIEAQRLYTLVSELWRMPSYDYRFKAGPVSLFGVNSNCEAFSWPRLHGWLAKAPQQDWKLVFTHHNLYGSGAHQDAPVLERGLWQLMFGSKVDLHLSGHEHQLEHLQIAGTETDYLISGGGGAAYGGPKDPKPREGSKFLHPGQGFLWVHASPKRLELEFFDLYGASVYRYQRTRKE